MRTAVLTLLLLTCTEVRAAQRPLIISTQDHSLVTIDDCAHFYTRTLTSFPAMAQGEEQRALDLASVDTLQVRASEEGGISIRGWDRPIVRLTVCKYAVALTQTDASRTLKDVAVSSRNGEISAAGPTADSTHAWWVHMILRVPKSATLNVSSANGGIAIRNMHGRITARATNGGISLAACGGRNSLTTENGGISLQDVSGNLQAATQNGPISLRLPHGSAVEARTADSGEIRCHARACVDAQASRDGTSRVLRLGGSNPSIRLSTVGAPILIEQAK